MISPPACKASNLRCCMTDEMKKMRDRKAVIFKEHGSNMEGAGRVVPYVKCPDPVQILAILQEKG